MDASRRLVYESLEARKLLDGQIECPYIVCQPVTGGDSVGPAVTQSPSQILGAYGYNNIKIGSSAGTGAGQTIAIIDAYNEPSINTDLATFDAAYGIPAPPSFQVLNQSGGTALPANNATWYVEEALDVEWAHAVAPAANIILFEANGSDYYDLTYAVDTARNLPGVSVVSMSWGGSEFSGEPYYDYHFTTPAGHAGVTFLAASGDYGAPALYPAVSPNVIGVGGTSLTTNGNGYGSEIGWAGSGGGPSINETEPSYQDGVQNSGQREAPDVAFDADPSTGVPVCVQGNWGAFGGTSLACPCWAGLIAIADQARAGLGEAPLDGPSQALPALYQLPSNDFNDITSGNNGHPAGPGYDMVTGLGTPVANLLVPALTSKPVLSVAMTGSGSFPQGGAGSFNITVSNAGSEATNGVISVIDTLPAGLNPTGVDNGLVNGWTLVTSGQIVTATRSDSLASGASYPALIVAAAFTANAPVSVANAVVVSGGGDPGTANDSTTLNVTITQPNMSPSGTSTSLALAENTAYTFSPADFGFSDPNSPPHTFLAVEITTLPGTGTLMDNGAPVTAGQFASVNDLSAGDLVYTPAYGTYGAAYANFTFQVENDGGTAGGGQNLDPLPKTISIAVDQADPDINVGSYYLLPNTAGQVRTIYVTGGGAVSGLNFNISVGNGINPSNAPKITNVDVLGTAAQPTIFYANNKGQQDPYTDPSVYPYYETRQTTTATGTVTAAGLLALVTFDTTGVTTGSWGLSLTDPSGVPTDFAGVPAVITNGSITIAHAPVAANDAYAGFENSPLNIPAAQGVLANDTDIDGNPMTASLVAAPADAASFTLNSDGSFSYLPAANWVGQDSFTYQVWDGHFWSNLATVNLGVAWVNQAPQGTSKTVTTLENAPYVFALSDFGYSDGNIQPPGGSNVFQAVEISTLPGSGTLTDNATPVLAGQFVSITDVSAGSLVFTPAATAFGTGYAAFTFQVQDSGGTANGGVNLDPAPKTMTVNVSPVGYIEGRYTFYDDSSFNGNISGVNFSQDNSAIATDKQALLPGQTASFANYTSYADGINGIMVDLINPGNAAAINAADFQFRVGNSNNPSTWSAAPSPTQIATTTLANGLTRIEIVWPNHNAMSSLSQPQSIANEWLQVVVLATADTNLQKPDVFYFGNAIGSTGHSPANAYVNATDEIAVRSNPAAFGNPASITNVYDFNRDGQVNATDEIIARSNPTGFGTALNLISVPGSVSLSSVPGGQPNGSGGPGNSATDPPVIADQSFSVREHSAVGTAVGTVVATDTATPAPTLSYQITAGNSMGIFAIDPATGQITVANMLLLDYQSMPTCALTVEVSDNGDPSQTSSATITVDLIQVVPVISVGNLLLLPNQPDQVRQIWVSNGAYVAGLNFNIRVGDGLHPGTAPAITGVDIVGGLPYATVFASNNTGQVDANGIPDPYPDYETTLTTTQSGLVLADGVLANVTFDTTGFTTGTWSLTLADPAGVPTDFAGKPAIISNGDIIIAAPPTVVVPASATSGIISGTTTALSVLGGDADWGEADLSYLWSVTSQPAAAAAPQFSANGNNAAKNTTVTFSQAGSYVFQVTMTDTSGLTATSTVDVTVDQTLTAVTVSPASVNVDAANTQQFTATGWDQFGGVLAVQPAWAWTLSGEGKVDGNGLYTPPEATGSAKITAADGSIVATASVAFAGEAVWNSSGNNSWNSPVAWSESTSGSAIAAPGLRGIAGDTAIFDATSAGTVPLDGANPSLAAIAFGSANGITIAQGTGGALSLTNSAGSGSLTVSAGSQTIGAPLVLGSNLLVLPAAGSALTISGAISGQAASVTVSDLGTVTLSGPNSYSGGTIVTSGRLVAANASALPAGSSLLVGTGLLAFGDNSAQAAAAGLSSGEMSGAVVVPPGEIAASAGDSCSMAGASTHDSIPAPGRQSTMAGLIPDMTALKARDAVLAQLILPTVGLDAANRRPNGPLAKPAPTTSHTPVAASTVWSDFLSSDNAASYQMKCRQSALDALLAWGAS
jgi:autotransporter-associated beta strand protein